VCVLTESAQNGPARSIKQPAGGGGCWMLTLTEQVVLQPLPVVVS